MDVKLKARNSTSLLSRKTVNDVDEFLKSEMRGDNVRDRRYGLDLPNGSKFVIDGYGRWKEVGIVENTESIYDDLLRGMENRNSYDTLRDNRVNGSRNARVTRNVRCGGGEMNSERRNDERSFSKQEARVVGSLPNRRGTTESYKHLSTSLRSNVFPGEGKQEWQSSTKTAFEPKSIPASWLGPEYGFGVKKDSYMEWAEYDVYRQRLMKAWDKYQQELPKHERSADMNVPKIEVPKEKLEKQPPKKPVKKPKPKPQIQQPKPETHKPHNIEPIRIEVKPAPTDDDFWDFYEQPFARS